MRMTLPKPETVDRDLDRIQGLVGNISEQYRTAYKVGLTRSRFGEGGRGPIGDSDPTGDVVTSEAKVRTRAAARRAAQKVQRAFGALDAAAAALEGVVGVRYSQPPRSRSSVVSEEEFRASLAKKRERLEGELDAG
jgi:hypothetical protein